MTINAPAGWYPDPARRAEQRFYNGRDWTEHVVSNGQRLIDYPNVEPPPVRPSNRWLWGPAILAGVIAIIGLILWIVFSVGAAGNCLTAHNTHRSEIGLRIGFGLMFFAPLIGWVMIPVTVIWRRSRPVLAWSILIIAGLIGAIVLAALFSAPKSCSNSTAVGQSSTHHVGDTVQSDDWSLVVRSVTDPYPVPTSAFYTPTPGMHLIGLDVVLTNTTNRVQSPFIALVLSIQDESGHKYLLHPLLGSSSSIFGIDVPAGGVEPGATLSGVMTFEIPDGATGLFVVWQPDIVVQQRIML